MCQVLFHRPSHVWHNVVLIITLWSGYHYYSNLQMRLQSPERLISYVTEHWLLPDPDISDTWFLISPHAQDHSENKMSYHVTVVLKWGRFGPFWGHLTISEDILGCHCCKDANWHFMGRGHVTRPTNALQQSSIQSHVSIVLRVRNPAFGHIVTNDGTAYKILIPSFFS